VATGGTALLISALGLVVSLSLTPPPEQQMLRTVLFGLTTAAAAAALVLTWASATTRYLRHRLRAAQDEFR
jgi:hypothetical protein